MKNLKSFKIFLLSLIVFVCFSITAYAKGLGIIDITRVIDNYTIAQEATADLKIKEAKLKKFAMDATKQIEGAKTPLEKKNLDEQLGEQFNLKKNVFAKEQTEKWDFIQDAIFKCIKDVSKEKKLEMVFNKSGVFFGGVDITDDVIKKLNEEAKK